MEKSSLIHYSIELYQITHRQHVVDILFFSYLSSYSLTFPISSNLSDISVVVIKSSFLHLIGSSGHTCLLPITYVQIWSAPNTSQHLHFSSFFYSTCFHNTRCPTSFGLQSIQCLPACRLQQMAPGGKLSFGYSVTVSYALSISPSLGLFLSLQVFVKG